MSASSSPSPDAPEPQERVQGEDEGRRPVLVPEDALPQLPSESDGAQPDGEDAPALEAVAPPVGAADLAADLATKRARVVAGWLMDLEPLRAPRDLDGCVVAAMNPGQRQLRAIDALASVTRVALPEGLAQLVASEVLRSDPQERQVAPNELDRMVEDRVSHPKESLTEGMVRRLRPMPAPPELAERVRAECESDRSAEQLAGRGGRASRPPLWSEVASRPALALAAALLVIAMSVGLFRLAGSEGAQVGSPSESAVAKVDDSGGERIVAAASGSRFRVVRVTEASMTDSDRAVLGALGLPVGGI